MCCGDVCSVDVCSVDTARTGAILHLCVFAGDQSVDVGQWWTVYWSSRRV